MKLTDREWKIFYIRDIFPNIQRGKRLTKSNQEAGDKPYVSSTSLNNGVDNYIGNTNGVRAYKDCLTIANSGSVGETFYHSYEFIASDHVTVLSGDYSEEVYRFLAGAVKRIGSKYNFNREINDTRLSKEIIMLPITPNLTPDWEFMEAYIREREEEKIEKYKAYAESVLAGLEYKEVERLEEKKWGSFIVIDIFNVKGSKTTKLNALESCTKARIHPYITTKATNNGIDGFYGISTEKGNVITFDSATIGYVSYQKNDFSASDHVEILEPKNFHMNEYIGHFLVSILRSNTQDKFNYGFKLSQSRMRKQGLLLPITLEGNPDWEYMEQYTKNIIINKLSKIIKHPNHTVLDSPFEV